jgi:ABC-type sugar transport system permease subunit
MLKYASDSRDYSTSNMLALCFAVVLLIAFIFLPWFGTQINANGARILSDYTYGTPGAIQAPLLWLIPLVSAVSIGLALFGVLKPEQDRLASYLAVLTGLAGVIYLLSPISRPPVPNLKLGTGFWLSLAACAGMLMSVAITHPAVSAVRNRILPRTARMTGRVSPRVIPYLFLIPAMILYITWILLPTLYTFYLSLTNWDGVSTARFIGFANFQRLFTSDRTFIEALINNVRWLVIFITIPPALGLAMAMIFNTEMWGSRFYKLSFYLPLILSLPVIGLVWAWVYNPRLGLINNFLTGTFGIADPPGWLGDRSLAIWCVIIAAVWRQVGYVMVLYLAGLKNVDPTLVDAARVDGANRWNLFRHVIFPLLAPVTTIVVVISIIDSLRAFDLVAIMTRGGQSTQVLANFMYIEAFNNYRMGYAAAIAVVLFAISMIFILFYLSTVIKDELEY